MRLLLLPFLALSLLAQDHTPRLPSIRTTGEATVTAKPDRAQIDAGVTTQAQTAEQAASENAAKLDAVVRELRKLAGAGGEVKTVSYSVSPAYNYPRDGGKPSIVGYTAQNIVQVTTDQIASVGKLIDAATRAGANTIHRLQFTLKDPQAAHEEALREAVRKARASAAALASAAGVKVGRVLTIEEGAQEGPIRPMEMMMAREAASAAVPTPIESGTLEVRARVTLTVEVSQ
jgi:uncharacterized protein YggE